MNRTKTHTEDGSSILSNANEEIVDKEKKGPIPNPMIFLLSTTLVLFIAGIILWELLMTTTSAALCKEHAITKKETKIVVNSIFEESKYLRIKYQA